jgi:hypothetical protein
MRIGGGYGRIRTAIGHLIEQGIEWRFHEHCTSAIDEADDSPADA